MDAVADVDVDVHVATGLYVCVSVGVCASALRVDLWHSWPPSNALHINFVCACDFTNFEH